MDISNFVEHLDAFRKSYKILELKKSKWRCRAHKSEVIKTSYQDFQYAKTRVRVVTRVSALVMQSWHKTSRYSSIVNEPPTIATGNFWSKNINICFSNHISGLFSSYRASIRDIPDNTPVAGNFHQLLSASSISKPGNLLMPNEENSSIICPWLFHPFIQILHQRILSIAIQRPKVPRNVRGFNCTQHFDNTCRMLCLG
jgi:hypothetical protein